MHITSRNRRRSELVLFEEGNKWALTSLLPEPFAVRVRALQQGDDSPLLGISEYRLVKEAARRGTSITAIDQRLRLQFWFEYDYIMDGALDTQKQPHMSMTRILGRTIAKEVFYKEYLTNNVRLAFMLSPPADYLAALEAGVFRALDLFNEIFSTNPLTDGVLMDERLLNKQMKLFEILSQKYQGVLKAKEKTQAPGRVPPPTEPEPGEEVTPGESDEVRLQRMRAEKEQLALESMAQGAPAPKEDDDGG